MKKVLHITNGDSAADIIAQFAVQDTVLPWRDPMHFGPFPQTDTLDQISRVRIAYLEGDNSPLNPKTVHALASATESHSFNERDHLLARSSEFSEIVLWFEHDLLDQLQVLQLLDWFADHPDNNRVLSIICIDRFAGVVNFRGIGQLSEDQMKSLYPSRLPVSPAMLTLAKSCWSAFRQDNPESLLKYINPAKALDTELPFVRASLRRHCQEFPWVSDGLSRTERQILTLVSRGVTSPAQLFMRNMDFESFLFIGDWRTYSHIQTLCSTEQPLLECMGDRPFKHVRDSSISSEEFKQQQLLLTDFGRRVLAGEKSAVKQIQREEWLGGVYLNSAAAMWFWDEANQQFITG